MASNAGRSSQSRGGRAGFDRARIQCYFCRHYGHIARDCPQLQARPTQCNSCQQPGHVVGDCPQRLIPKPAQQWQRLQPKPAAAPRETQELVYAKDNKGMELYRAGHAALRSLAVPNNFNPFVILGYAAKGRIDTVAEATETHIISKVIQRGAREQKIHIDIWGEKGAAAEAERQLRAWIDEFNLEKKLPVGKIGFAHIRSTGHLSDAERQRGIQRFVGDQKAQKFLRGPLMSEKFRYRTFLRWEQARQDHPTEVLGPKLQALDMIRVTNRCHICWSDNAYGKSWPGFEFYSSDKDGIQKAVHRVMNFERTVCARRLEPATRFLVKAFAPAGLLDGVKLVEYLRPAPIGCAASAAPTVNPLTMVMTGEPLDASSFGLPDQLSSLDQLSDASEIVLGHAAAEHINALRCSLWFEVPMATLQYYDRYLEMKIDVGSCVFTNCLTAEDGTYSTATFKAMLEDKNELDSELESFFSEELGDRKLEARLAALTKLPLFSTERETYSAVFVFLASPEHQVPKEYFRFDIDFQFGEDDGNALEMHSLRWTRSHSATGESEKVVDINLIDLQQAGLSYNLNIRKPRVIDHSMVERQIPGILRWFTENITLRPRGHPSFDDPTACFLKYPTSKGSVPSVPIIGFQQRRNWNTVLSVSGYRLVVSEIQNFEVVHQTKDSVPDSGTKGKNKVAEEPILVARERRWGAHFINDMWELELQKNPFLHLGEAASWVPEEWYWFPPPDCMDAQEVRDRSFAVGDGFKELFRVLGEFENMVMD